MYQGERSISMFNVPDMLWRMSTYRLSSLSMQTAEIEDFVITLNLLREDIMPMMKAMIGTLIFPSSRIYASMTIIHPLASNPSISQNVTRTHNRMQFMISDNFQS